MNMDTVLTPLPSADELWIGNYKIPWNEASFSERMLAMHLSQDHDMASRRASYIKKQVQLIDEKLLQGQRGTLLDLGCGPGLYLKEFQELGYEGRGIDFSPASVKYAQNLLGDESNVTLGDLRSADFGEKVDVIIFLYGELNVFSPNECKELLAKMKKHLKKGGKLILEPHTFAAVKQIGESENSWYKCDNGLFGENPHICLTENSWYEEAQTALQRFFVITPTLSSVEVFHSTTKAYDEKQYKELLTSAGYEKVTFHEDWPVESDHFQLISAQVL